MSNYASIVQADAILAVRLGVELWDAATDTMKTAGLTEATEAINNLAFIGEKADETQVNEFPRGTDTDVPDAIITACAYEAFARVDRIDAEEEIRALSEVGGGIGKIRHSSRETPASAHILAGIMSVRAWRLLLPFINKRVKLNLIRVS